MITPSIADIQAALSAKGYIFYTDRPNLIGIRSGTQVPNTFNCTFVLIDGTSINHYAYTTIPGVPYLKNLMDSSGTAIIHPGQYIDAYELGYHQGKDGTKKNPKTGLPYPSHKALRPITTGPLKIVRDNNLDTHADFIGKPLLPVGGAGTNIHGGVFNSTTPLIGQWSAGCQVFKVWSEKESVMAICESYRSYVNNKFTYTLIMDYDLNGISPPPEPPIDTNPPTDPNEVDNGASDLNGTDDDYGDPNDELGTESTLTEDDYGDPNEDVDPNPEDETQ